MGRQSYPRCVGKSFLSPWVRVKDGDKTRILQINGQPAIPETLPDAEYVDFYGPAHVVIKQPDGQGGFVWSMLESATGKKVTFTEAKTFRWNWNLASHGVIWMQDKATNAWRLMGRDGHDFGHSQPVEEKPDGWCFLEGRAPLHKPDGWIYVDPEIKPISPDKWEKANDFSESRAAVQREGKWGFLALDGKVAIPLVWDAVRDFHRGLAAVQKEGRWGYIDPQGKIIIEPVWDAAEDFREWNGEPRADGSPVALDVAKVRIHSEAALIDRTGALIVDPSTARVSFEGDAVQNGTDVLIVMEKNGAPMPVKRAWWIDAADVSAARGWKPSDPETPKETSWNLIDETGRALTDSGWSKSWYGRDDRHTDPLSGGLISARDARQKVGLLRRDGTTAVPAQFDALAWVAPGVAAVWTVADGGLIDTKGAWLFRDDDKRRIARFPAKNRKTDPQFQHGLVIIEDVPKWGYARLNR